MNRIIMNLQKKSALLLPAALFVCGILFGQLAVRAVRQLFPEVLQRFYVEYQTEAAAKSTEVLRMFGYLFVERAKGVLVFWLLNLTIFGLPYYMFCLLGKSFQVSFLFGAFLLEYKGWGLLLGVCNYFPELLCLLPMYYLCLRFGLQLIGETKNGQVLQLPIGRLIKKYGLWILLCLLLCAASAALTAWFGSSVTAWAIRVLSK